jgi:acyl-CoA synthetase (AMP-forming)/AMP-acid ligase II
LNEEAAMQTFRDIIAEHLATHAELPWLTLVSSDRATPFTIRQIVERTYDYCAFYRSVGIAENDTVVIILRESLDLIASFFAGIVCGALPAYYFYPSPKQSTSVRQVQPGVRRLAATGQAGPLGVGCGATSAQKSCRMATSSHDRYRPSLVK